MKTEDAYNNWAHSYDTVDNKTRDLESAAIKSVLRELTYGNVLEIGCGTGKNTTWLAINNPHVTAVDFSAEMLQLAKQKNTSKNVTFLQADITKEWSFKEMDLITCSLVLEHIRDLSFVFSQAASTLKPGGRFYICELHPYKQLQGSRARFEKEGSLVLLEYFIHHISECFQAAAQHRLVCDDLQEWFDDHDKSQPPRLVSYLFRKS